MANMNGNYENQLICEQTEGPVRWCSQCERDAEDCCCEELSDHFREVMNSGSDVRVPAESESHQALSGQSNRKRSSAEGGVVTVEASVRAAPAQSFSKWLEAHGDSLPLPQSFSEWLERTQDKI